MGEHGVSWENMENMDNTENMVFGQLNMGEHEAKCRALDQATIHYKQVRPGVK